MERFKNLSYFCRQNATFLTIAPLVILTDQLSKLWIKSNLAIGESIFEIGFFRLTYVQNTGSSFGLFQNQNLVLSIVAIIGASFMLYLVFFMRHRFEVLDTTLGKLSLALIFGGALGNLINRLSFGYVIDFINFNYWPAFNIADSSTVVGSILIAYTLIRLTIQSERKDGKSN
jgi:signal peptidase II